MDEGIGLRENEIGTIFDGYSMNHNRSADTAKGMGIGLSICKTIVNAHGGTITAQNREHGGAMFTFTLPLEGDSPNES
jgi:two-component system sensor histidine kinase KdpD